jgi:hypothetical protein
MVPESIIRDTRDDIPRSRHSSAPVSRGPCQQRPGRHARLRSAAPQRVAPLGFGRSNRGHRLCTGYRDTGGRTTRGRWPRRRASYVRFAGARCSRCVPESQAATCPERERAEQVVELPLHVAAARRRAPPPLFDATSRALEGLWAKDAVCDTRVDARLTIRATRANQRAPRSFERFLLLPPLSHRCFVALRENRRHCPTLARLSGAGRNFSNPSGYGQ